MTLRDLTERSFRNSFLFHTGVLTAWLFLVLSIVWRELSLGVLVGALVGGLIYGTTMAAFQTRRLSSKRANERTQGR